MRPRLIAVDDEVEVVAHLVVERASMRPRLIAVDDLRHQVEDGRDIVASMRPRLIAVDDPAEIRLKQNPILTLQ